MPLAYSEWLTCGALREQPWEAGTEQIPVSEMLRTLEFGPSQVGLTGRGLGVRTTPRCEHQFWGDQMEVAMQLINSCSLHVLRKGLEKNSRFDWSLKDE